MGGRYHICFLFMWLCGFETVLKIKNDIGCCQGSNGDCYGGCYVVMMVAVAGMLLGKLVARQCGVCQSEVREEKNERVKMERRRENEVIQSVRLVAEGQIDTVYRQKDTEMERKTSRVCKVPLMFQLYSQAYIDRDREKGSLHIVSVSETAKV